MAGGAPESSGHGPCSRLSPADIPTGPTGTGHAMKLLNNFLSIGYAALYSEALMLGAKVGD